MKKTPTKPKRINVTQSNKPLISKEPLKITCKSSCSASMSWIEIASGSLIQHDIVLRES